MSRATCVICLLADAVDDDYCAKCSAIAAEVDADDSVSCADSLRVCQQRARREEALRDCPPVLRAEMDRDLANALILGRAFDRIFGVGR